MGYNDIDLKFERSIQLKLQEKGYEIDLHVGHSEYKVNIAVVHPDDPSKYILSIETDGKIFYSAQSSSEKMLLGNNSKKIEDGLLIKFGAEIGGAILTEKSIE